MVLTTSGEMSTLTLSELFVSCKHQHGVQFSRLLQSLENLLSLDDDLKQQEWMCCLTSERFGSSVSFFSSCTPSKASKPAKVVCILPPDLPALLLSLDVLCSSCALFLQGQRLGRWLYLLCCLCCLLKGFADTSGRRCSRVARPTCVLLGC